MCFTKRRLHVVKKAYARDKIYLFLQKNNSTRFLFLSQDFIEEIKVSKPIKTHKY